MNIIISFVLLLAVASQTTNILSSFGGNSITLDLKTPFSGIAHNLTFTTTAANTLSIAIGNNLNVLCVTASDANYTLGSTATGFSYQAACTISACSSSGSGFTLTQSLNSVTITYTSDISIGITAAAAASSGDIRVMTASSMAVDMVTTTVIPTLPLPGDPLSYHVCWSGIDTAVDFGVLGSPLAVANRYNATINKASSSSPPNSLSFVGLAATSAAVSAAIVSLI